MMDERLGRLYDAHGEMLRFLIVGVWNTALSYAAFYLAIRAFAAPLEAVTGFGAPTVAIVLQWAVWVLAVVHSTATMKYFAFRSPGHFGKQVFRSYFVYLPAQGIASLILFVAMHVFGLSALMGQLIAVFIGTILSYLGHKYFTFRVPLDTADVPTDELIER